MEFSAKTDHWNEKWREKEMKKMINLLIVYEPNVRHNKAILNMITRSP